MLKSLLKSIKHTVSQNRRRRLGGRREAVRHRMLQTEFLEDRLMLTGDVEYAVIPLNDMGSDNLASFYPANRPVRGGVVDSEHGVFFVSSSDLWSLDRASGDLNRVVVGNPPVVTPTVVGDSIAFHNLDGVFLHDLDTGARQTLSSNVIASSPQAFGDGFVFAGYDGFGWEPWISDLTYQGTKRIRNVGADDTDGISRFTHSETFGILKDRFVFLGDTDNSRGLWVSDGTETGTQLLKDGLFTVSSGSLGFQSVQNAELVYFNAYGGGFSGIGVWRTDGTATGTIRVHDGSFTSFAVTNDNFLFTNTEEIYESSIATGETKLIFDGADEVKSIESLVPLTDGGVAFWGDTGTYQRRFKVHLLDSETGSARTIFGPLTDGRSLWANEHGTLFIAAKSWDQYKHGLWATDALLAAEDPELIWLGPPSGSAEHFVKHDGTAFILQRSENTAFLTVAAIPIARLDSVVVVEEGSQLILNTDDVVDLENAVVSYAWDVDHQGVFVPDSVGTEFVVATQDGPFDLTVALRVVDVWGQESIAVTNVMITNVPPVIAGLGDTSAALGSSVTVSADVSDPGINDTLSIQWDLGDGTILNDVTSVYTICSRSRFWPFNSSPSAS
ncbi:MAG: hypothetical protein GY903_32025 [Fuerstiella sp.]|nr:hypothetical protein [Fuerstiella sp.]MCP4859120.1 hypothetical protein [Fuerstiella sp.]